MGGIRGEKESSRPPTESSRPPKASTATAARARESAARARPKPRVCEEKNRLSLQALRRCPLRHRLDGWERSAKTHAQARAWAPVIPRSCWPRWAGRAGRGAKLGWRCVSGYAGGYPQKRRSGCVARFAPRLKCPGLSLARTVIECGGMKPTILTWANAHLSHWHADARERFERLAAQCWDPRTGEPGLASLAASLAPEGCLLARG